LLRLDRVAPAAVVAIGRGSRRRVRSTAAEPHRPPVRPSFCPFSESSTCAASCPSAFRCIRAPNRSHTDKPRQEGSGFSWLRYDRAIEMRFEVRTYDQRIRSGPASRRWMSALGLESRDDAPDGKGRSEPGSAWLNRAAGGGGKGTSRTGAPPCHGSDRVPSESSRTADASATGAVGLSEALSKVRDRPKAEVPFQTA
jgi:hypothetical protein